MTMGHPARDLWYFLQVVTDPGFRSKHLESVLEAYYAVFSSYLQASGSGVNIEFNVFRKECDKWRAPISLIGGNNAIFFLLNPVPDPDMEEMLCGATKETEEHPLLKEIRRRIVEGILELDALGLLG